MELIYDVQQGRMVVFNAFWYLFPMQNDKDIWDAMAILWRKEHELAAMMKFPWER